MFEALFKITALVESGRQGQCTFKVYERKEPVSEHDFSSLIDATYQQQVYPILQARDELTLLLHVNLPNHELEKTLRMRDDQQFEADWLPAPTADLLPQIASISKHFRRQVLHGNVFTITFRVQRF